MSPDCIQNVDNWQAQTFSTLPPHMAVDPPPTPLGYPQFGLRPPEPVVGRLGHHRAQAQTVMRMTVTGWRVAPRTQPAPSRRTTAATSSSGRPTGQAADAAARSGLGPSPSTSEE